MKKLKISFILVLLIVFGVFIFRISTVDIKDNTTVDSNKKVETENRYNIDEDTSKKDSTTIDSNSKVTKKSDSLTKNVTGSNTTDSASDYSVLVQSPIYDAIVSLDKSSKEINVKLLDDSNIDSYTTDKYINLTEYEISYLKENANVLLKEFEDGSLLDKYSFVSDMLKEYDTNINMGDLINIAMTYLK